MHGKKGFLYIWAVVSDVTNRQGMPRKHQLTVLEGIGETKQKHFENANFLLNNYEKLLRV
jgi:hypothetical protein